MLFIFARFEPRPGNERQLLEELTLVTGLTRAETGCVRIQLYESVRGPLTYFIHSEWVDEDAFEAHGEKPHTVRFVEAVTELIAHPFQASRTRLIG